MQVAYDASLGPTERSVAQRRAGGRFFRPPEAEVRCVTHLDRWAAPYRSTLFPLASVTALGRNSRSQPGRLAVNLFTFYSPILADQTW